MRKYPKGMSVVNHAGFEIAQLYDTRIVIVDHNTGEIIVNSGGWKTKHTKKCSNEILNKYGYHLYQKDFNWYIEGHGQVYSYDDYMKIPKVS